MSKKAPTTITLDQFVQDFTPEQKRAMRNHVRYYDVLVSLKETRKKLGLTQEELAEKANVPRTTITKVESGKYNPTLNTLMNIATALNKTLEVRLV